MTTPTDEQPNPARALYDAGPLLAVVAAAVLVVGTIVLPRLTFAAGFAGGPAELKLTYWGAFGLSLVAALPLLALGWLASRLAKALGA